MRQQDRRIKVEIVDGKLFLDGTKQDLEQEEIMTMRLRVRGLDFLNSISFYS